MRQIWHPLVGRKILAGMHSVAQEKCSLLTAAAFHRLYRLSEVKGVPLQRGLNCRVSLSIVFLSRGLNPIPIALRNYLRVGSLMMRGRIVEFEVVRCQRTQ